MNNFKEISGNTMIIIQRDELIEGLKEILSEILNEKEAERSEQPENVSKSDTLAALNVSDATLWRWEKRGYLKPIRIGRQIYYKRSDINELLNA